MHYCRFEIESKILWGIIEGDKVAALTSPPWLGGQPAADRHSLNNVRLLAPATPTKIVCVGRNYRDHAAELNNPVPKQPLIFLKPPSSIIGPEQKILYPAESRRVDYEGELALVIGRRCRNVPRGTEALACIFGFTCLNDVTARDLQKADGHFTRGKGFDTFCPVGPVIATGLDPADLTVESFLNGERRQNAPTTDMIFPPDVIIEFVSGVMTLEPGDLITTGTPAGVGPLQPGDTVDVVIDGIGQLRNRVAGSG